MDYYNSVCEGYDVCTGDCPVDGDGTQQCIPALDNAKSIGVDASGVPITLETLEIDPGYWRSLSSSATILPCWNKDAYFGGFTGEEDYCAGGYTGPCELESVHDAIWMLVIRINTTASLFLPSECVVKYQLLSLGTCPNILS